MWSYSDYTPLHVYILIIRIYPRFKIQDILFVLSCVQLHIYCKLTNFGVLLYLANLANCVFSLIFVAAKIYVDRTLHRRAAGRRQSEITLF